MTIKAQIVAHAVAPPHLRNVEIAGALNVKPSYVSEALREAGMDAERRERFKAPPRFTKRIVLTPENRAWAIEQSLARRLTIHEFVDQCVKEARENQEKECSE